MHSNYTHKGTAVAAAALLLCSQAVHDFPVIPAANAARSLSVTAFAAMLAENSDAAEQQLFSELRFDPAEKTLICSGENVGQTFEGWQVLDGSLVYSENGRIMTPEEAAEITGCEITEADGETVIRSPFQTGRLIVKSSRSVDTEGGREIASGFSDLHVLQYDSASEAYSAYQQLSRSNEIGYVCPDRLYQCDETDAEYYGKDEELPEESWGKYAIGADVYCDWLKQEKAELPEITVAVIDSGIYAEHNWFKGRIAEGGRNFCLKGDGTFNDDHGHGTHCAGIICHIAGRLCTGK